MKLAELFRKEMSFLSNVFTPTLVATICNHETKREGPVTIDGRTSVLTLSLGVGGRPQYCLDCIERMAIRCVLCERVIHVGDSFTLYKAECFETLPAHAVRYKHDEEYVIGCIRPSCADVEIIPLPSPSFAPDLSPYGKELLVAHRLRTRS